MVNNTNSTPLKPEVQLSHSHVLPGPNRKVMVSVKILNPKPTVQASVGVSREVKPLIDTSGSTDDPAGPNSRSSILDETKAAVVDFIDQLPADTHVSFDSFSDSHKRNMKTQTIGNARELAKKAIRALKSGGGTGITKGLRQVVESKKPGFVGRALVITDGLFNRDRRGDLFDIMASPLGLPTWFVGIGVTYDDEILRELADAGPEGSAFFHVTSADELSVVVQQLLDTMSSIGGYTEVTVQLRPLNGATVDYANRFVPGYAEAKLTPNDTWTVTIIDDSLDAIGQQILVGIDVPADSIYNNNGQQDIVLDVLEYQISYKENGIPATPITGKLSLTITGDPKLVQANPPNQTVLTTLYLRRGHNMTLQGDLEGAATLMQMAGQTHIAVQLQTLVASGGGNEALKRETEGATRFAGRQTLKPFKSE